MIGMSSFRVWVRRTIVVVGVLALLAGLGVRHAPPAAATGGFQDGFENPVATPNSFDLYVAGQQMGVWTITRGDVHLIGAGFWQAAEGVQSIDLDGGLQGAVATTIATVPLVTYKISYRLAGNPAAGPTIKTGQVLVNGQSVQNFSFDITGKTFANMGYVQKSFLILTLGHSVTLGFSSTTTPSGFGPVLDKVVVQSCLLILCPSNAVVTTAGGGHNEPPRHP
jgi:choice-of-anchor C domain-containing protein